MRKDINSEELIKDYNSGLQIKRICEKYKCGLKPIYRILNKAKQKKHNGRKYLINEGAYLDKIDSHMKAYFLGWVYSDGTTNKKRGSCTIAIHKDDSYILDAFNHFFFNGKAKLYSKKNSNCIAFPIVSREFHSQLELLGLKNDNKTFDLDFPHHLPKQFINSFLLGFFDGDGYVGVRHREGHKSPEAILSFCGTKSMCEGIRSTIFKYLNIEICPVKKHDKIFIVDTSNRGKIEIILNWMYKDMEKIGLFLTRKREKAPMNVFYHKNAWQNKLIASVENSEKCLDAAM